MGQGMQVLRCIELDRGSLASDQLILGAMKFLVKVCECYLVTFLIKPLHLIDVQLGEDQRINTML